MRRGRWHIGRGADESARIEALGNTVRGAPGVASTGAIEKTRTANGRVVLDPGRVLGETSRR